MGVTTGRALVTVNFWPGRGSGSSAGPAAWTQGRGAWKDSSATWGLGEPGGAGTGSLGRRKGLGRTAGEKNLVETAKGLRVTDTFLYEESLSLVHKSALNSSIMIQLLFQEALKCSTYLSKFCCKHTK